MVEVLTRMASGISAVAGRFHGWIRVAWQRRVVQRWGLAILDLIHPPICLACRGPIRVGSDVRELCVACQQRIHRLPSCRRCGHLELDEDRCPLCRTRDPEFATRTVALHDGAVRDLLIDAKWSSNEAAIPLLAHWLFEVANDGEWCVGLDAWVAVPRDRWRQWIHGTPLAEQLGREIGPRLGLRAVGRLSRRRRPPQVRLTGQARRENVHGAVSVSRWTARRVRGKRVLLVDDVITTGSTLTECVRALHAAGAGEVRALTIAYRP